RRMKSRSRPSFGTVPYPPEERGGAAGILLSVRKCRRQETPSSDRFRPEQAFKPETERGTQAANRSMLCNMAGRGSLVAGGRVERHATDNPRPSNQRFGGANMAIGNFIRNPIEWGWDHFKIANVTLGLASHSLSR